MIVQHREDHSDRLKTREATCKMIEELVEDETRPIELAEMQVLLQELQSNSAVFPSISEYLYHRQATNQTRNELVLCLEQRENAKLALRFAQERLKQTLPVSPCKECNCHCSHRDAKLVAKLQRRSEDFSNDEKIVISDDILRDVVCLCFFFICAYFEMCVLFCNRFLFLFLFHIFCLFATKVKQNKTNKQTSKQTTKTLKTNNLEIVFKAMLRYTWERFKTYTETKWVQLFRGICRVRVSDMDGKIRCL